jgi:hypothetical protein
MKASKIALCLFSGGFVLFSLYKYLSQKRITKEQISKIIKKISNLSVHFIFQKYDSQNKILNQKKEKEEKNFLNNIMKDQNNNNINTYNKIEESFDNEILFVLLQIENEKIKSLGITNEEFQEYILEYKDDDIEITKNFNLIQKVLNSFKQRKLPVINFGFIIPDKYLQIISNIYYFNLKQSYLVYYNKINNLKNNEEISFNLGYKEKNEIFSNIYNTNLKETRKKISEFFGIDKDNNLEINIKLALRIFPFYYDKEHNLRKKYQEINDNVNKLINIILKSNDKLDILINENNKFNIKDPVDKIIDFDNIINEINSGFNNNIINKEDEIPYEDQWD